MFVFESDAAEDPTDLIWDSLQNFGFVERRMQVEQSVPANNSMQLINVPHVCTTELSTMMNTD